MKQFYDKMKRALKDTDLQRTAFENLYQQYKKREFKNKVKVSIISFFSGAIVGIVSLVSFLYSIGVLNGYIK